MNVEIIDVKDDIISLKAHSNIDIQEFEKNAHKGRLFGYLEPYKVGTTTDEQRKHYWALIKDISDYTGEPQWKVVLNMKYLFMVEHDLTEEPSLARNRMKKEITAKFIQLIIDYCLENDIPLRNSYLSAMESRQFFIMTMKRICWITHKPNADLCHFENTVGMGRNRNKIDHTQSKFMTLSRELHQEQHRIGEKSFCEKYHIQPISLSNENLKELGVI